MAGFRAAVAWMDRRRSFVALALAGWAVVIAAAAGAQPSDRGWLGIPDLSTIVIGALVIYGALALIIVIVASVSIKRGEAELPERRSPWPMIVMLILFFLILSRLTSTEEPAAVDGPAEVEAQTPGFQLRGPDVGPSELLVVLGIAVVAIGAMAWSRWRRAQLEPLSSVEAPTELDLGPILDGVADRLHLGSDPRSAVLEAYASLEDALADRGYPRTRTETPAEHVTRVLSRLPVDSGPITDLALLYERARYSQHRITADDQRRAATALDRVRHGLSTGNSTPPSTPTTSPSGPGPS